MTAYRFLPWTVILSLGLNIVLSCTNATLAPIPSSLENTIAVKGQVCTRLPINSLNLVRVLLVIDSSDGLAFVDPNDNYSRSLQALVDNLAGRSNISFGLLRFGQTTQRALVTQNQNILFTNDPTILDQAFGTMQQTVAQNPNKYLGGIDYTVAMTGAHDYIANDIASMASLPVNTTYLVAFIVASAPQSDAADANQTVQLILTDEQTMLLAAPTVFMDVYGIFDTLNIAPIFQNLLTTMATKGLGTFSNAITPDNLTLALQTAINKKLIYTTLDLARLQLGNTDLKSSFVMNRQQLITQFQGNIASYLDSDGDGLADIYEISQGYNPYQADTDNDGLDDFFEDHFKDIFSPTIARSPPLTDDQKADTDNDGLNAFIENQLGTNPDLADSDNDGVNDGMEFRFGTNPLLADLSADYDNDGRTNGAELAQHLNPNLAEPMAVVNAYAYQVTNIGDPNQTADGRLCYDIDVNNVTILESAASIDGQGYNRPDGYNAIEINNLERPLPLTLNTAKLGYPNRMHQGKVEIITRPSVGWRDPPATTLIVRPMVF